MLALICLGWKLSTRLEYWWWLLCTPPCSSSSFFFYLSLSPILAPTIYPLFTYSTFCLLNWFPASCLSPPFLPSSSRLSPRCSCTSSTQISLPPLLSFYPSLHLTSLYLSRCSVYHLPATLSGSIPSPPFCLFSSCFSTNSSPRLSSQHPPSPRLSFLLWLFCFLWFSVSLLSSSFGLPPVTFLFLFPPLCLILACELAPGLSGSRGWWDVKSEVCVCVFLWQRTRETSWGKLEEKQKKTLGEVVRWGDAQPALKKLGEMCLQMQRHCGQSIHQPYLLHLKYCRLVEMSVLISALNLQLLN